MKIIATIDNRKFIAELSFTEIDYLAGKKIGEDKGYYRNERTITAGTTFNIIEAFEQIHRNDRRKDDVEMLRNSLTFLLNGLDMVKPLIEEPKVKEPTAELTA